MSWLQISLSNDFFTFAVSHCFALLDFKQKQNPQVGM